MYTYAVDHQRNVIYQNVYCIRRFIKFKYSTIEHSGYGNEMIGVLGHNSPL